MPGSTLPNISIILPSLGGDEGIWDSEINAALTLIDAHDHTTGKGIKITPSAMNINADLAFGDYFISALGKVSFTAIAAPSTGSKSLFVSSADNELYWRTNAGTNVKLTSGTTLNTSLVGGIVGDYASVGAEVAYDDANDRYTFKQQSTKPWARIACGPVRIFEFNTTETVYVELISPSTLASSYTITLPDAAPASAALLQMTSAGVIATSGTIATALVSSTTITASEFKHSSELALQIPAAAMSEDGQSKVYGASGGHNAWTLGNNTNKITIPITLKVGDKITGWSVYYNKTTNASTTLVARLYRMSTNGGTVEVEATPGASQSSAANAPGSMTLSETGLTETVGTTTVYYLVTGYSSLVSFSDHLLKAEVSYTRS